MDFAQVFSVAFGSASGAMFAFLIDLYVRRRHDKNVEVSSLNNLIVDLHTRRALSIWEPTRIDAEIFKEDMDRTIRSVIQIRDLINDTRKRLRPRSALFETLVSMTGDCNNYLEFADYDRSNYQFYLEKLNDSLTKEVRRLCDQEGVIYREPGQRAFQKNR